jgi:hypothetical protein
VIDLEDPQPHTEVRPTPGKRVKTGPKDDILTVVTVEKPLLWVP